jgi:Fur family zinc uptake transcriptional regulator
LIRLEHLSFPTSGHDHHACVRNALRGLERLCRTQGLRLTPIRRRVLELIWQSHRPSGAYEILGQLAAEGRKASPPTVYRALGFLLAPGLAHRVSSRNAFVGCDHPGEEHMAQIFLCDHCSSRRHC